MILLFNPISIFSLLNVYNIKIGLLSGLIQVRSKTPPFSQGGRTAKRHPVFDIVALRAKSNTGVFIACHQDDHMISKDLLSGRIKLTTLALPSLRSPFSAGMPNSNNT